MKIPSIFLNDERNLEDKLKHLCTEPEQSTNNTNAYEVSRLEKTLEELRTGQEVSPYWHIKVQDFLRTNGYTEATNIKIKLRNKYWIRPNYKTKTLTDVFISSQSKNKTYYSFASVWTETLNDFAKSFEKYNMMKTLSYYLKNVLLSNKDIAVWLSAPITVGGIAGGCLLYYWCNPSDIHHKILAYAGGAGMGAVVSTALFAYALSKAIRSLEHMQKKYRDKAASACCYLTTDNNAEALKSALG